MNFFKKTDGPGFIRIKYCGFVPSGANVTQGWGNKIVTQQNVANKAEAITTLSKLLKSGTILDAGKFPISLDKDYKINISPPNYLYTESQSQPGKYYHDFRLVNSNDHFCNKGGKKIKNKTKAKKNSKSRKTRRYRK